MAPRRYRCPGGVAIVVDLSGHVKVTDTYWYVTAIPDLMNTVNERFERFVSGAGKEQEDV